MRKPTNYPPQLRFSTLNLSKLFVATLATLFSFLAASAQGEWKWAHYWSGGDGSFGDYYNEITNTAFDEEGNIYIYGTMGGSPQFDGLTFQFVNNGTVLDKNDRSILLAKFDTLGNMLWYKVVKSSVSPAFPRWMEVRNNNIYISGDVEMDYVDYNWNNVWLYYLDTLIRGSQVHELPIESRKPPYMTGRWTFFVTLNTDGELLRDHFVEVHSREYYSAGTESYRVVMPLCANAFGTTSPFHVDDQGNIYVYTQIDYRGSENDPLTVIVDGDSNKTYELFLPGNVSPELVLSSGISNAILYKFSLSGELLLYKLLVDHTDGIASSYQYTGDSVNRIFNTHFEGLSFDENDNMYLTGYFQLADCYYGFGGESHNYPVYIWWDSTHHVTMHDITSAEYCNFIIKCNNDGEILWSNQLHTMGENFAARSTWFRNVIADNYLYLLGSAGYNNESIIYFDDENSPLQRFQDSHSDICFFARYDAETGAYLNHGIVPAFNATSSKAPAVVSNRVLAISKYNSNTLYGLSMWKNDGTFIQSETIQCQNPNAIEIIHSIGACVNDNGYLLASFLATSPIIFSNNVSSNCPSGLSSAVFALYHNPEFATPFVPDDSVGIEDYLDRRERDIYISPNPTSGPTSVHGYMYGYQSIELYDLQGRKLADLVEAWQPSNTSTMQPIPAFDLSPYPTGTYLVKINFERGVSVVRKVVKR